MMSDMEYVLQALEKEYYYIMGESPRKNRAWFKGFARAMKIVSDYANEDDRTVSE